MRQDKSKKRSSPRFYSDGFKRQVVEEYLLTGESKMQIQRRHGIKFQSAILRWIKDFGYTDVHRISRSATINTPELPSPDKTISTDTALEQEIRILKRQLADERLRSEMLNRMVDLAEKTYKIPVRKNYNTK